MTTTKRRKQYDRLILYCNFCQKAQKDRSELLLIHLEEKQDDSNNGGHTIVKICLRCRDIIDPYQN